MKFFRYIPFLLLSIDFGIRFAIAASEPLEAFHKAVEDAKEQLHSIKATFGLDDANLARQRRRTIDELLSNFQKGINWADEREQSNSGPSVEAADERDNRQSEMCTSKPNCGDGECPGHKPCIDVDSGCGKVENNCGDGGCGKGNGGGCPGGNGVVPNVPQKKEIDLTQHLNEIAKLDKKYKFSDYRPYKVPPPLPLYLMDNENAEHDQNRKHNDGNLINKNYREMSKEENAQADRFLNELHFDNIDQVRSAFKMDEKAPLAVTYDEAVANIYFPAKGNNDQTETKQNDLSHEADYKLSKIEQEAAEKNKDIKWKQKPRSDLLKRSMDFPSFNPMGEIKLLTSHRLMSKGFGPSLPSYSLVDYKKERMIDDMLKHIEGKDEKVNDLDRVDNLMYSVDDNTFDDILNLRIKRLNEKRDQQIPQTRNVLDYLREPRKLSGSESKNEKAFKRTKRISEETYKQQMLANDKLVEWQKQLEGDLVRWKRISDEQNKDKSIEESAREEGDKSARNINIDKSAELTEEKNAEKNAEKSPNKADDSAQVVKPKPTSAAKIADTSCSEKKAENNINKSDEGEETMKITAHLIKLKPKAVVKQKLVNEIKNKEDAPKVAQNAKDVKTNKEDSSKPKPSAAEEKPKLKRRVKRIDSMAFWRDEPEEDLADVSETHARLKRALDSSAMTKIRKKRFIGTEYDILGESKDFDTFEANEDEMHMRVKRSAVVSNKNSEQIKKRCKRSVLKEEYQTAGINQTLTNETEHNIKKRSFALDDEDDNNSDIWRMSGSPLTSAEDDNSDIERYDDYDYTAKERKKRLPFPHMGVDTPDFDFDTAVGSYGNQKFDNLNQKEKALSTFEGMKFDNMWYDNTNHKLNLDDKFNNINSKETFETPKDSNNYNTIELKQNSKIDVSRNAKKNKNKKKVPLTRKTNMKAVKKHNNNKKKNFKEKIKKNYISGNSYLDYVISQAGGKKEDVGDSAGTAGAATKSPTDICIKDNDKDMVLKLRDQILNCTALSKLEDFLKSLPSKQITDVKTTTEEPDTTEAPEISEKPEKPEKTKATEVTTTECITKPTAPTTPECEQDTEPPKKSGKVTTEATTEEQTEAPTEAPSESPTEATPKHHTSSASTTICVTQSGDIDMDVKAKPTQSPTSATAATEKTEEVLVSTIPTSPWPKPMISNKPKCPPNETLPEKESEKEPEKPPQNQTEKLPTNWSDKEKDDLMKLNITINANVVGDKKGNNFYGNGSINVEPGLMQSEMPHTVKRGVKFPGYKKEKSKSCDPGDNQNPPYDLLTGKLSSQVVKSIFGMVKTDPKLKMLWPSLKRNRPGDKKIVENFYAIRNKNTEKSLRQTEQMMRRMMDTVNNMIDDQVRTKTCVPLRPDLTDFYDLILKTHRELEKTRQKREDKLSLANEFSDKLRAMDPSLLDEKTGVVKKLLKQYEELTQHDQEQVSDVRDELLMDLVYLRKLQEGLDMIQERRKREIVLKQKLNLNPQDTELMKKLEGKFTPEFLKLLKTSELFREYAAGSD